MSSLERLAVAPGIAPSLAAPAIPLRSRRYGEDRLHLLVRDPHRVLAVWEISPALAARATARASEAGAPLRYRIEIERRAFEGADPSVAASADLPDAIGGESWYLDLPEAGGEARAVLGLDLRGTFERLLSSRWTPVPPDRPCADVGAWDLAPEGAAWLARQGESSRALADAPAPSSVSRYLVSPARPKS